MAKCRRTGAVHSLKGMVVVVLLWGAVSLLPYLVAGETWGMIWMYLNAPLSFWLKSSMLADFAYPHGFVLVTTALNAALLGLLASLGLRCFRK